MDHLSAAGSSATRNLTTTEPSESLNRRKTVDFRFQRPHATSRSFFFNKPMRAMDSRRDFTSKKVFPGYFPELSEKANSGLPTWKKCPAGSFQNPFGPRCSLLLLRPPPILVTRASSNEHIRPTGNRPATLIFPYNAVQ